MVRVVRLAALDRNRVAVALTEGGVIAPVLGGYCVLSVRADELRQRLGNVHRLLDGDDVVESNVARRLLRRGCVCVLAGDDRGAALREPWLDGLDAALGVPDEPLRLGAMIDDFDGWVKLVIQDASGDGPGPTVVDLSKRPPVVERRGKLPILDVELEVGEMIRIGPGGFVSILVVCTGNSCRSPMAAALLNKMLAGLPAFVYSAGTEAPVGQEATRSARQVAAEFDLDIHGHRARQLTPELCRSADLILVMAAEHRDWVRINASDALSRVRFLAAYPDTGAIEVPDPVGRSLEFYRRVARQMMPALERVAGDVRYRIDPLSNTNDPVQEE